ncbi:MAG: phosphocholine cytidylyltransferase family protein [Nitrospirae bacterium]|nr:phosphocholine cytidylyltransferase family protein [Nitrospirota bacterium]
MQAIILAAGRGSRLNSNDDAEVRPKCLVDFNDRTLLEYQLSALYQAGIDRVCVVTGYGAEKVMDVAGSRAEFIYNNRWSETNSLYSVCLCRDWVDGPVMVMNCDVLAHGEVFHSVAASAGSAFAYDSSSGGDAEHMKVELEEGYLKSMSKRIPRHRTMGENVGILRFETEAGKRLFDEGEALIRSGGANMWMAAAVERVARHVPIRGIDIAGLPWVEIDFPEDLRTAREKVWPRVCKVPALTYQGFTPRALLSSVRDDIRRGAVGGVGTGAPPALCGADSRNIG